jgi:hypothetical protein
MSPNWFLGNRTLDPRLKWAQWCFTARPFWLREPQSARLTSGAKCKHVGSVIWGLNLVKASNFLLTFGFLTCFVLWCPQPPSLLFVKELGKPVINDQAEPAPTLMHAPSWMRPFPDYHCKTHKRNVKFELRDPDLV